ncbi:MAG: hypothetical protein JNM40_14815 [Myxococcales bacterium]|nr:hypothetical protein [Myxococcales bacterium]
MSDPAGTKHSEEQPGDAAGAPSSKEPAAKEPAAKEPAVKEPKEEEQTATELRSLLSGLGNVSAPSDLSERVPQLIERRSRGRFFGQRRLHERIPFVWVSLGMLILSALLYSVLRMAPSLLSSP